MTLWIVFAALVVAALAWIAWPLLRPKPLDMAHDGYDAAVYLDQLDELEKDRERGLIDESQAEAARTEIERRLLAAARAESRSSGNATRRPGFAIALAMLVPVLALPLYFQLGSPELPNQPFADRVVEEAPVNSIVTAARDRLAEAERRTEANPEDPDVWFDLGRFRLVSGDVDGAVEALARAMETSNGRGDIASAYGESLSRQADGLITPEARRAFETALAANPGDPRSRYFLALADFQEGREQAALEAWSALARTAPPNAPWLQTVVSRVIETAQILGENPRDWLPRPPVADAPRGPSAEDVAAARQMSPDERMEMIRGMVANLAARLEEEPDDVEGWRRLASSREVLGEPDAAAAAYGRALELDPDHPDTLLRGAAAAGQIGDAENARRRLARLRDLLPGDAGVQASLDAAIDQIDAEPGSAAAVTERLTETIAGRLAQAAAPAPATAGSAHPGARGPSAADMAAAQEMSAEDRAEMIRGMVAGLAARLEDNPGDVEGWRRLARSREVLEEPEAAAEAYTRALALEPDHPETLLRGALAAGQLGDHKTARTRFVRLRGLVPPDSEVYRMVGEAISRIDAAAGSN